MSNYSFIIAIVLALAAGCVGGDARGTSEFVTGPADAAGSLDASPPAQDLGPEVSDVEASDVEASDMAQDIADTSPDAVEDTPEPAEDVSPTIPEEVSAYLPLGETLFMAGDDFLAFWGHENPEPVEVLALAPDSALPSDLIPPRGRLTPDALGDYILKRGADVRRVRVSDGLLTEDTFHNYNYSPVSPLAVTDGAIWVATPTSNAVHRVEVSPDGERAAELVPTGSWPTATAAWGDHLLVAQTGRDSLGFLDLRQRRVVDAIRVGDEPASIIVDTADPLLPVAYVAISGENAVVKVDLQRREVLGRVDVSRDPRAMAFDSLNRRLFVASLISSNATPKGALQREPLAVEEQRDIAVIDVDTFEVVDWVHAVGTTLRGLWLDPQRPELLVVARTHSNNAQETVDFRSRPHEHGLSLVDIRVGSQTLYQVTQEIDLDTQSSSSGAAANPYSVSRTPDGSRFVVTLSSGRSMVVLDADTFEEVGRLETGHDPRGVAFVGDRVLTYAWLDNVLVSWPLEAGERRSVLVGDDPTPADVKEGQRIFNDARFSGNDDISCGSCHIEGLADGLVWNILLDGDVNTLPFRNIGGTAPFLWGGFLPTLFDFSREVLRLVGATASGRQMDLLTHYMQSVTAPPNPHALPGGQFTEEAEVGRGLFFLGVEEGGAGCGSCHSGPLLTNLELVEGKTPSVLTDVPSLIGVYDTGPWGRRGQWETLEEMVGAAVDFTRARLSEGQEEALLAYVRQLPGDVLYLTSATPLSGAQSVWSQTPVSLVFSSVLVQGQESLFECLRVEGDDLIAVAGLWEVRGRRAIFEVEQGLELDSSYVIRVSPGLRGTLGRTMTQQLELGFSTGGVPAMDVSGRWLWRIEGLISGEVVVAMVQSMGGHIAGTILQSAEDIDFDHVEGFIAGAQMLLDPFHAQTSFGQVFVQEVDAQFFDRDEDGMADAGVGVIRSIVDLDVTLERLDYPLED